MVVIVFLPNDMPGFSPNIPIVRWGDSTKLGVGDPVLVGGYPYGTELFKKRKANRGIIQPTFIEGIVSAIIPAQNESETRILQLSSLVAGGMSGGAVTEGSEGYQQLTNGLKR